MVDGQDVSSTVQAAGDAVVWRIFSWHTLGTNSCNLSRAAATLISLKSTDTAFRKRGNSFSLAKGLGV